MAPGFMKKVFSFGNKNKKEVLPEDVIKKAEDDIEKKITQAVQTHEVVRIGLDDKAQEKERIKQDLPTQIGEEIEQDNTSLDPDFIHLASGLTQAPQDEDLPQLEKKMTTSDQALPFENAENVEKARLSVKEHLINNPQTENPEAENQTENPEAEPEADNPEADNQTEEPRLSWFKRLHKGLSETSSRLSGQISHIFTSRKLDDDTLQDLEDLLIRSDLGLETTLRITDILSSTRYGKDVNSEEVSSIMAAEIEKTLSPVAIPLELDLSHKPHVILVVGVNGTGKTTTIGKLAAKLTDSGLNVMLAAGDTFRAAAIEQLKIWGERTHSTVISSKHGADAAGLVYDAYKKAKHSGADVLIIDTAGRLQNKTELMDELAKIVRVLAKHDVNAPHTVLQTLDATTGQNALNQVDIFRDVAGVNGLVMTKLDGTARGGILVAISAKYKLPVYFIGIGEGVDDLEPFEAGEFAQALVNPRLS